MKIIFVLSILIISFGIQADAQNLSFTPSLQSTEFLLSQIVSHVIDINSEINQSYPNQSLETDAKAFGKHLEISARNYEKLKALLKMTKEDEYHLRNLAGFTTSPTLHVRAEKIGQLESKIEKSLVSFQRLRDTEAKIFTDASLRLNIQSRFNKTIQLRDQLFCKTTPLHLNNLACRSELRFQTGMKNQRQFSHDQKAIKAASVALAHFCTGSNK